MKTGSMNTQALCPDISSAEPIFTEAENAVRCLLLHMGEDPNRDELDKTPSRVLKALREMTAGYREDPAQILQTRFAKGSYKQMIILQNISPAYASIIFCLSPVLLPWPIYRMSKL